MMNIKVERRSTYTNSVATIMYANHFRLSGALVAHGPRLSNAGDARP